MNRFHLYVLRLSATDGVSAYIAGVWSINKMFHIVDAKPSRILFQIILRIDTHARKYVRDS